MSRPSQKFGTEMPSSDTTIAAWSTAVFCRNAASTPLTRPDDEGEHERIGGEQERDRQALEGRLHDGLPEQDRAAEIAMQKVAVPAQELHEEGLVEPEIVADLRDHLRRGGKPGDGGGRIAGHEMDHREGNQADDQQDRHGAAEPTQDDAGHGTPVTA